MTKSAKKTTRSRSKAKPQGKVALKVKKETLKSKKGKSTRVSSSGLKKKITIYRNKQTRLEILQTLAENTGLPKVQIEKLFLELVKLIEGHLNPKGSGEFSIPFAGMKLRRFKKKRSPDRTIFSPLIGKEVAIAGKPARNAVKVTALKPLKDMVEKK